MTTVILSLGTPVLPPFTRAPLMGLSLPPVMMSSIVPSLPSYTGRWSLACRLRNSAISSCCCCLFFWAWTCTSREDMHTVHCAFWHTTRLYLALSKHLRGFIQLGCIHLDCTLGSCCLASWASNFSRIASSCFFLRSFCSTASCWGVKREPSVTSNCSSNKSKSTYLGRHFKLRENRWKVQHKQERHALINMPLSFYSSLSK